MNPIDLIALTCAGRLVGYPMWTKPVFDRDHGAMALRGRIFLMSTNAGRTYFPRIWLDNTLTVDLLALSAWYDQDGEGFYDRIRLFYGARPSGLQYQAQLAGVAMTAVYDDEMAVK